MALSMRNSMPAALVLALMASAGICAPAGSSPEAQRLADPKYGPIPGQSTLYSDYRGKAVPFPANITSPVYPTASGAPGEDDVVWQNLLAAEWIIFNFYQQGVDAFNGSSFAALGLPNTTYDRIQEIRDNEAGHLRIFQNQISPTSVKPGSCRYEFPFTDAASFLELALVIEIGSMAFLSGLVQEPRSAAARGAMLAISDVETRHTVWNLIDVMGADPFSGPADTVFPYANQILQTTNRFVVPGSCPQENPTYPDPGQDLPPMAVAGGTTSIAPGATVGLNFTDPTNLPAIQEGRDYFAVFFHAVGNISVPVDVAGWQEAGQVEVAIPRFEEGRGVIIVVLADVEGAPDLDSVVAGPEILLEQPEAVGLGLA